MVLNSRRSAAVLPTGAAQLQGGAIAMQHRALHFTHEHGVVAMGNLTHQLAFHGTKGIVEHRQAELTQLIRRGIEAATDTLLRLEEHGGQILLIGGQHVQGEAAGALNHAVAGAVGAHRHHNQGRFKGTLGHPAGGETIQLLDLGHATDEHPVGDLAQEGLLGFSVEGHGRSSGGTESCLNSRNASGQGAGRMPAPAGLAP